MLLTFISGKIVYYYNIIFFYLFSVFWLTKVLTILFIDYSVIVKCFLTDSFIEYIILLLKLFVNVSVRIF